MKMPREDSNQPTTSIRQSKVPKLHQHRHQLVGFQTTSTTHKKTQLPTTCQCSSFLNTCHLSTHLCRWCQAVTKTCWNQRRKELSIHATTIGKGCVVKTPCQTFCDILAFCCFLSVPATRNKCQRLFFVSWNVCRFVSKPFNFNIIRSSTNSGFALRLRFAATKFIWNSFLCYQLCFPKTAPKRAPTRNSTKNSTQRSNRGAKHLSYSNQNSTHPTQDSKIQPWHQALTFWEVRTPTSYRYPLSRKKALCLCIFACIYKHRLHCVQNDVFVRVRGWNFWGFPRSHLFATVQRRNAEKRTSALLDTKKMTSHKTHKTHPNGLPLTLDTSEKPTRSEAHTHKSPQARPCRRPLRTAAWTETLRAHFVPKWAAKQANSTCNPQNDALRHDFPRQAWFQFPAILSLFTGCRTNLRRLLGHLQHHPKSVRRRQ